MATDRLCECGCGEILTGKQKRFATDRCRAEFWKQSRLIGSGKISEVLQSAVSPKTTPVAILENLGKVKRPGSHYGRIDTCPRLQKTHERLKAGPATTRELSAYTGSEAVHSDIHELRQNGIPVAPAKQIGRTPDGHKIMQYRLEAGA